MKLLRLSIIVMLVTLTSCSSLKVTTDYDTKANFGEYKTFAFYKKGIDKSDISDLDKKRILRAIESELLSRGFAKSNNPDMLISIFTKSRERVNVTNNNFGWGWGWGWGGWGFNPWGFGANNMNVRQYTEGTLFIDFIDKEKKELFWQGVGTGVLKMKNPKKKEERIREFVKEILSQYPPEVE